MQAMRFLFIEGVDQTSQKALPKDRMKVTTELNKEGNRRSYKLY
jgi:hypothetical protein